MIFGVCFELYNSATNHTKGIMLQRTTNNSQCIDPNFTKSHFILRVDILNVFCCNIAIIV